MNSFRYIEAVNIENIGSRYENEGYQVIVSPLELGSPFQIKPIDYTLTASKCCRKFVIEVVERGQLDQESERLEKLREQAHQEDFYDFLLGILSPPLHTEGKIERLDGELFDYLVTNVPDHLAELPAKVRLLSVGQIGLDSLSVTDLVIKAVGNGIVEVELENGFEKTPVREFSFPLNFDVELDHHLRLKHVHDIAANTSGFYNHNSVPPTAEGVQS